MLIESYQHQTAEKTSRAIAIDAIIGWQLVLLTLIGSEAPQMPCQMVFSARDIYTLKER